MSAPAATLAANFAQAMHAVPRFDNEPIAIGFSGGGDSLALLALVCAHSPKTSIHALIVDHALRPESAMEANRAAEMATALGAKPAILCWETPRAGHNHARIARYSLLAKACRNLGTTTLYLAHTLDDQEETFCMRLARGSSARGLACMSTFSPFPVWPQGRDLWLARPLLGTRRQTLRHWLTQHNLDWIDDPSNRNRRYSRVRWREKLADLHQDGLASQRIAHSVRLLGQLENLRRRDADTLLNASTELYQAGYAVVDVSHFASASPVPRDTTLAAVMAAIAGTGSTPLPISTVRRTAMRLLAEPGAAFSVAGCHVRRKGSEVLISRDPGAVLGRSPKRQMKRVQAQKGQKTLYDSRFEIIAPNDGWIETLGERARALPPQEYNNLMALPAAVRPTLPVLRDNTDTLSSPLLGGKGVCLFLGQPIIRRNLAPFSHITE